MQNLILSAREKRSELIESLKNLFKDNVLICIKANIVGLNKNISVGHKLVEYFDNYTEPFFENFFSIKSYSDDGLFIIKILDETDIHLVKKRTVTIEDTHEIGRYIDIDVYKYGHKNISRSVLSYSARKCFVCDNLAFVCNRTKKHDEEEIIGKMKFEVSAFLLFEKLADFAFEALVAEVLAFPKFGCVSALNSGCHSDMDVDTFLISAISLKRHFFKICQMSYNLEDIVETFKRSRNLGKVAEKEMFIATNGVNTHKGALFVIGVTLIAVTKAIYNGEKFDDIKSNIKKMSIEIVKNELEFMKNSNHKDMTYGEKIFKKSGLTGIRGEVESGLNSVFTVGLPVFEKNSFLELNYRLVHTLIHLMSVVEDTTLLHKSYDQSTLKDVKEDALKLKKLGGYSTEQGRIEVDKMSKIYIDKHLSPGGSADLLAVTYLLYSIKNEFNFNS